MNEPVNDVIGLLEGQLAVSCQALPDDPLNDLAMLVALAESAEAGGAAALRICGVDVVRAVRAACAIPIIGITKHPDRSKAYITPTLTDAQALVDAGADIVAVDATERERPHGETAAEFVALLADRLPTPIMADISTRDEGVSALDAGASLVATTLSGYTTYSRARHGVDLELIRELSCRGKVIAEGRIHSPEVLRQAFDAGAFAAVVGRAITRPQDIVRHFLAVSGRTPRASTKVRRFGDTDGATASGAVTGWLGVDAGQSGLRATLVTADGRISRARTDSGQESLLSYGGREELKSAIRRVTSDLAGMHGTGVHLESAYVALTGVAEGTALENAAARTVAEVVNAENIFARSDITAAHAGAFAGGPGIVAVAGTGSSVFGCDGAGGLPEVRAGGWGYLFGDECGAIGIAIAAIRGSLDVLDSTGETDALGVALARDLTADGNLGMVPKQYYAGRITRAAVAASARVVTQLAAAGDGRARAVVDTASDHLAGQIRNVARRVFAPGKTVPWSVIGGVARGCPGVVRRVGEVLSSGDDFTFEWQSPLLSPSDGAALLASQHGGRTASSVVRMRQWLLREEVDHAR